MKFTFTNKKVNLPKAVHAYAEKKFGKLQRYFENDVDMSVVFSVEKEANHVEATLRSGNVIIRASESTSDMYASIDAAVAYIERKMRRNKTRLEKRLRQDAFTRSVNEEEISSFVPDTQEDELNIVRTKRFPIKPMSCEEAVLEMNLLGHSFFAFKDESNDGAFAVVYVRDNGDYGLIEDDM